MTAMLFLAIRTALSLSELRASGAFSQLHADIERLAANLKALAVRDDGSIPTDDELRAMIVEARNGFQAALDDD